MKLDQNGVVDCKLGSGKMR